MANRAEYTVTYRIGGKTHKAIVYAKSAKDARRMYPNVVNVKRGR